jgi:hypothetical protein
VVLLGRYLLAECALLEKYCIQHKGVRVVIVEPSGVTNFDQDKIVHRRSYMLNNKRINHFSLSA